MNYHSGRHLASSLQKPNEGIELKLIKTHFGAQFKKIKISALRLGMPILQATLLYIQGCSESIIQSDISSKTPRPTQFIADFESNQSLLIHIDTLFALGETTNEHIKVINNFLSLGFPRVVILIAKDAPTPHPEMWKNIETIKASFSSDKVTFWRGNSSQRASRWIRDWIPLAFADSEHFGLMNFQYFQVGSDVGKNLALSIAAKTISSDKWFEGGNFATNGKGKCFIGKGGANPLKPASQQGIKEELLKSQICKDVIELPSLKPQNAESNFVATNHIDMWMKIVSTDTAFVATIDKEMKSDFTRRTEEYLRASFGPGSAVSELDKQKARSDVETVQKMLDEGARELERGGMKVRRIPHPVPILSLDPTLNAIQQGKKIMLSKFIPWEGNGGTVAAELWVETHRRAEKIIEAEGFEVLWMDVSSLLGGGGALHCATAQLPHLMIDKLFQK